MIEELLKELLQIIDTKIQTMMPWLTSILLMMITLSNLKLKITKEVMEEVQLFTKSTSIRQQIISQETL